MRSLVSAAKHPVSYREPKISATGHQRRVDPGGSNFNPPGRCKVCMGIGLRMVFLFFLLYHLHIYSCSPLGHPPPLGICQLLVPSYDCPLVLCIISFCVAINPIVRVTIGCAMSAAAPVK